MSEQIAINTQGYVCYYRVSTKGQAKDKADGMPWYAYQQYACRDFLTKNNAMILDEFNEIASGTEKTYRPEFSEAVDLCIKSGATLFAVRLDRIARSVKIFKMLELLGVKIVTIDMINGTLDKYAKQCSYQSLKNVAISYYDGISTKECLKTLKIVMGPVFDDLILPESCDEEFLSC